MPLIEQKEPRLSRRRRSIAIAVAVVTAATALVLFRPFSRYKLWPQVNRFSETQRIRNFRTMDELFPTHTIHRSDRAHHFATRPTSLPVTYVYRGQRHGFDEFFERTVTTGFLVLKDDIMLVERYFRGTAEDTPLTSWSVAKSVVSLLVGIARDEGLMSDLDAPLARYAPELADSDYGRVPVRALLPDLETGMVSVSSPWIVESTTATPRHAPRFLTRISASVVASRRQPRKFHGNRRVGQNVYVDPSKGIVIVKTSVDPDFARNEDETVAALQAVNAAR